MDHKTACSHKRINFYLFYLNMYTLNGFGEGRKDMHDPSLYHVKRRLGGWLNDKEEACTEL
jgi:hypothetical protein